MEDIAIEIVMKELKVITKFVGSAGALIHTQNLAEAREILGRLDAHLLTVQQILADAERQVKIEFEPPAKKKKG